MFVDFRLNGNFGDREDYPYKLFDANGNEVKLWVFACDTITGECHIQVRDYNGKTISGPFCGLPEGEILTAIIKVPAPLTIVGNSGRAVTEDMLKPTTSNSSWRDKPSLLWATSFNHL